MGHEFTEYIYFAVGKITRDSISVEKQDRWLYGFVYDITVQTVQQAARFKEIFIE